MHPFGRWMGSWGLVFTSCVLGLCSGCGVQIPVASGTSGTSGGGGSGGGNPGSSQAMISVNPASLPFGNVTLNTTATQPVTLSSTGTATLQIASVAASGAGFALSVAPALPLNVPAGQSATVYVAFTPAIAGSATGGLRIVSNAANSASTAVILSGAGIEKLWTVVLTWGAPKGGSAIVGYNVYRAASGTRAYVLLNASPMTDTTYSDASPGAGSWDYVVRSVDTSGVLSGPSNVYTAVIP